MKDPLTRDSEDPKRLLPEKIMIMATSCAVKQAMARHKAKPIEKRGHYSASPLFRCISRSIPHTYWKNSINSVHCEGLPMWNKSLPPLSSTSFSV